MKSSFLFLLTLAVLVFPLSASAQFSVQEADSSNRFRFLNSSWNTSFYSLASTETEKMNNEGGRISTYNYFTFRTYLPHDYRFALRVPFLFSTAGTDRFNKDKNNEQELSLSDLIVAFQNYNLLFLPWDLGLYWEGRFYLPTSRQSKDSGLITRLRNNFILSKVFSQHFEMEYDQKVSYYLQSRSSYPIHDQDEDGFELVDVVGLTKRMEFEHDLRLWAKITPQTGVGLGVGSEETYYNKSETYHRSRPGKRTLSVGPQLRFPLASWANFILAYEDVVDRDENPEELGRFLAQNTQFVLHSFIRF
ncbi:MAG: hypothetical protein AB7G93_09070 [Bdellovibrionales bacterium]